MTGQLRLYVRCTREQCANFGVLTPDDPEALYVYVWDEPGHRGRMGAQLDGTLLAPEGWTKEGDGLLCPVHSRSKAQGYV